MPVTKKTYVPLIEIPAAMITRCSQVLPNRLQCWKAGDYLVEEVVSADLTRSYQLCSMHTVIQQRADTLASQEEASGKAQPEDSDPKSIHSKMLQVEQRQKQSTVPSGEKTAQR